MIPKEIRILKVQGTRSVISDILLPVSGKPTKHKECNHLHLINGFI